MWCSRGGFGATLLDIEFDQSEPSEHVTDLRVVVFGMGCVGLESAGSLAGAGSFTGGCPVVAAGDEGAGSVAGGGSEVED